MKKNFKIAVLLIALGLIALMGVSKVAYAQSNNMQDERGIFDPFTLNTIVIAVTETSSDAVVSSVTTRPPIRIPVRPALRSYFRPTLVQLQ